MSRFAKFTQKSHPLFFSTISTILLMQTRYIYMAARLTPQTKLYGSVRTEKIPTLPGMPCAPPQDFAD
jgi:nuclear pore complex protein Nup54